MQTGLLSLLPHLALEVSLCREEEGGTVLPPMLVELQVHRPVLVGGGLKQSMRLEFLYAQD